MASVHLIHPSALPGATAAEQLALAGQLLRVLATEFAALQAGDSGALAATATDKMRLLKSFDPHMRARLPATQREQLDELLREARDCNQRNGAFIAAQQAYVRARWAGLSAIAGLQGYYNAEGQTHALPRAPALFGHA